MSAKRSRKNAASPDNETSVIIVAAQNQAAVEAVLNTADPVLSLTFQDDMPRKADVPDGAFILALGGHPGDRLCAELESGASPEDAVAKWRARVAAIRQLNQLPAVEEAALIARDDEVLAVLADHLSVSFDETPEGPDAGALEAEISRLSAERDQLRDGLTGLVAEAETHLETLRARDAEVAMLKQEAAKATVLRADAVAIQRQLAVSADIARMREAILGDQILCLSREVEQAKGDAERLNSALADLKESALADLKEAENVAPVEPEPVKRSLRIFRRTIDKSVS